MINSIIETTIKAHIGQLAKNVEANNALLTSYKNRPAPPPPTLADRLRRYKWRVQDAWKVLTGQAWIAEDED